MRISPHFRCKQHYVMTLMRSSPAVTLSADPHGDSRPLLLVEINYCYQERLISPHVIHLSL